jgi:hypothetical protein
MTPEFFDGPISREYREILESEPHLKTAPSPKGGTEGIRCKSERSCPKAGTAGVKCKSEPKVCPDKSGTGGTKCKSEPKVCKKAHAVVQNVPGWSFPAAPPS